MPRDAVSRTANVERNGGHKWVNRRMDARLPNSQRATNYLTHVGPTHREGELYIRRSNRIILKKCKSPTNGFFIV